MIIYDSHFNHLKTKGIPSEVSNTGEDFLYFGTIFDLSANIHLLIPSSLSKNKNSIIIYDSNKEEILKSISYSDDILAGITMQNNCFSNISDSQLLFYPPSLSNYVYNFNTQTLTLSKRFGISWKEKGIDLEGRIVKILDRELDNLVGEIKYFHELANVKLDDDKLKLELE